MNANVNLAAPVSALALLGTGFLIFVAAVVLAQSLIVRKPRRARVVLIVMLVLLGVYLAAILGFSLVSHEKVLARGEEKHFGELDCHLAYSIAKVQQTKTLANASNKSTARGTYTVVTIKTRFDETTIAPWRGNGLLYPNSRSLTLFDERGNLYGPSSQSGTLLTTPLRPGESYTSDVVFDLPADVKAATLLINEGDWITHLVIGHENSPLHKKTRFQVDLVCSDRPLSQRRATVGNHIVASLVRFENGSTEPPIMFDSFTRQSIDRSTNGGADPCSNALPQLRSSFYAPLLPGRFWVPRSFSVPMRRVRLLKIA